MLLIFYVLHLNDKNVLEYKCSLEESISAHESFPFSIVRLQLAISQKYLQIQFAINPPVPSLRNRSDISNPLSSMKKYR